MSFSKNRILLYQMVESCQLISFLVYMNVNVPSNVQGLLRTYYATNVASLIPNPFSSFEPAPPASSHAKRVLTAGNLTNVSNS